MVVFLLVCEVFYTYLGAGLACAFAARVACIQQRQVALHTYDLLSRQPLR
jgi:F0F1-type ATP synthase membrane subunit c/vacuolar-type H+-ATPase subunit K